MQVLQKNSISRKRGVMKKEDLPPYHELFELPEGESPKDFPPPENFAAIKLWVKRFGSSGLEECPRPWLLSEIPDRASFFDMFGGGRYEIEGRRLNGTFYARRTLMLVGDPKPLVPRSPSETQAAPAPAPSSGFSGSGLPGELPKDPMSLLIVVMMQNAERAEQRAERAAVAAAQQAQTQATMAIENMKLLATIFGGQRSGTDPVVAQALGHMTDLVKSQLQTTQAPAAAQRTVEEELKRATDLISLAKKVSPSESPEKFTDIVKEVLGLIPPELAQQVVAGLTNGGNGVPMAPQVVENVIVDPVG